jgi:hypothetical protein
VPGFYPKAIFKLAHAFSRDTHAAANLLKSSRSLTAKAFSGNRYVGERGRKLR